MSSEEHDVITPLEDAVFESKVLQRPMSLTGAPQGPRKDFRTSLATESFDEDSFTVSTPQSFRALSIKSKVSVDDLQCGSMRSGLARRSSEKVTIRSADDSDVEKYYQRRPWNSTSTMFVDTTMEKPNIERMIRSVSIMISKLVYKGDAITSFDEPVEAFLRGRVRTDRHFIYRLLLDIYVETQLALECIVIFTVYLDRVLETDSMILTIRNLRPVLLTCLMLASKMWDDVSMWNCDFEMVFPEFPLRLLNLWERTFLDLLEYNVVVDARLYAEYYFQIRKHEIRFDRSVKSSEDRPMDRSDAVKLDMVSLEVLNKKEITHKKRSKRRAMTIVEENPKAHANRFVLS